MNTSEILHGTLKPDGSLELDQKPSLPPGPVRITVERVPSAKEDTWQVLHRIWADRLSKGMVARSREEIDASIDDFRNETEVEMQELEHLHKMARGLKE